MFTKESSQSHEAMDGPVVALRKAADTEGSGLGEGEASLKPTPLCFLYICHSRLTSSNVIA